MDDDEGRTTRALGTLDPAEGRAMRALAGEWRCDASHATQIVDRLERVGLAERRTVAHDRRVKLVGLTAAGAAAKRELLDEFHTPPAALFALKPGDLAVLDRVLEKLGRHSDAPTTSANLVAPGPERGNVSPEPPRAPDPPADSVPDGESGKRSRAPAPVRRGTGRRAPTR